MVVSRSAILREAAAPFSVELVDHRDPRPGEALVRLAGAGMCHTDQIPRAGLLGEKFLPAILGHEGTGVVESVGAGVSSVEPGDHVVLTFGSCGACPGCRSGQPFNCAEFELRNLAGNRSDGSGCATDSTGARVTSRWFAQSSFGQFTLATERNIVKAARDVPLTLLGPLWCGVQTGAGAVFNTAKLAAGQSIAVFGTGAVGLSAIMAAKASGAGDIVAVDLNPARCELALELGATRAIDGAAPELVAVVRGPGAGLDVSFDTTGLIELWRRGLFPFDRLVTQYPLEEINRAEADANTGKVVEPVLVMAPESAG